MADGRPAQAGASRAERLDRAIQGLLGQSADVLAAAVVSFDGLPMASALPGGMDEDRVAAMSAALLSLGERAAQGLGRGELSQVYIEGEDGTVFLVSCDNEAVLVAVGARHAKVGLVLFEVRRAAAQVAAALRDDVEDELDEPLVETVDIVAVEPVVEAQPVAAVEPVAEAEPVADVEPVAEVEPVADEPATPAVTEPFYVTAPSVSGWDLPAPATPAPAEATHPAAADPSAEPVRTGEPRHSAPPAYVSYAPSGSVLPGEPPRWS